MSLRPLALAALFLAIVPAAVVAAPVGIQTHVGMTTARFVGAVAPNVTRAERLAFSVSANIPLVAGLSLEPGIGFAGRGCAVDFHILDDLGNVIGSQAERYDADYVQAPLVLRAAIGRARLRPALLGGVDIARKTGERYRFRDYYPGAVPLPTSDLKTWDWGVIAGGGLELDTPVGIVMAEGRYTWGMTDIFKVPFPNGPVKNRDLQLLIGVRQDWPWHR